MADHLTPQLDAKYRELDNLIQEISRLEGIPEKAMVSQWVLAAGVVEFEEDGFLNSDVMVLTPGSGHNAPVWQVKGLLDTAMTKYRALETENFLHMCEGDEEGDH